MKSSLQKNFAIAFYRYRMWLEEQSVPAVQKAELLRQTNHFLAYMTFSSCTVDFRKALQKPEILQKALRAYTRFLRSSMNCDASAVKHALSLIKQFCDFNELSIASSTPNRVREKAQKLATPAVRGKLQLARPKGRSFFPEHLS